MDGTNETRELLNLAKWVDNYSDSLIRYALSRLRNFDAAEAVVQETILAALKAVNQFSGTGAEGAWLLGILKRKIVNYVQFETETRVRPPVKTRRSNCDLDSAMMQQTLFLLR